jgi:pimeloyl-ACP methyl ester carboxylesterase
MIPVKRVGSGEHAVIALHGWFGSGESWGPFPAHLDGSAFSYFFLDFRGYGARLQDDGQRTISEAAADVIAMADEQDLSTFSLVGHSMGGSIMQRVALDAPGRVRGMVGVSPVPASGVPFDANTWGLFADAADNPDSRRAILDFSTGGQHTAVWLDAMVRNSLERSDRKAVAGYLAAWAKTDFHAEVVGSEIPIRLIVGANDPSLGEETMKQTFAAWYRNAEIVVLPGAGHYAMDETPIALATQVESFLSSLVAPWPAEIHPPQRQHTSRKRTWTPFSTPRHPRPGHEPMSWSVRSRSDHCCAPMLSRRTRIACSRRRPSMRCSRTSSSISWFRGVSAVSSATFGPTSTR